MTKMIEEIPVFIYTFLACFSFCFIFRFHKIPHMIAAATGGMLSWVFYVACMPLGNDLAQYLISTIIVSAYAEVMARVRKCPAMPYLVIAILPLLPGAGVYYTMSLGLEGNRMDAVAKGLEPVGIAGSLAVGILLVSTVFRLIYRHVQGARAEKS